jgi:quinol-cytochrome oxidoreductase complex cytochrome b subunit
VRFGFRLAIVGSLVLLSFWITGCGFARFVLPWGQLATTHSGLVRWLALFFSPDTCFINALIDGPTTFTFNGFQLPRIFPPWHVLPFFAMMRAVPSKFFGLMTVLAAFVVPLSIAIYDWAKVSTRSWALLWVLLPAIGFGLMQLGVQRPDDPYVTETARVLSAAYFAVFLLLFPLSAYFDRRRAI